MFFSLPQVTLHDVLWTAWKYVHTSTALVLKPMKNRGKPWTVCKAPGVLVGEALLQRHGPHGNQTAICVHFHCFLSFSLFRNATLISIKAPYDYFYLKQIMIVFNSFKYVKNDRRNKTSSSNNDSGRFYSLDDEFPCVSMQGNIQIGYNWAYVQQTVDHCTRKQRFHCIAVRNV